MDDVELLLYLVLGVWLFVAENMKRKHTERRITFENHVRLTRVVWKNEEKNQWMRAAKKRRLMMSPSSQRPPKPLVWALNRSSEWWDVVVPGFTKAQWVENFRMSENTFNVLCNKLYPVMQQKDTNLRGSVPLKKRVAVALWKLATGSEYRSIGQRFGVGVTTVCQCVQEFCVAAEALLVPQQIRFPNEETFREMAIFNEYRWGLPHCIGAIGGAHIPIMAPQEHHWDYFNDKGWHSIILQGVVDGQGCFWNICAGMPGSMDGARVLRLSVLWELATRGNLFPAHARNIGGVTAGYYVVGDSTYPLQNWLLKPFEDTGRLTAEQQTFNKMFSRGLAVADDAFGRLRGRWRCLLKRNDCDLQLVNSMVVTCCALHNLCENRGEVYQMEWDGVVAATTVDPDTAATQDAQGQGTDVRMGLMHYMLFNS